MATYKETAVKYAESIARLKNSTQREHRLQEIIADINTLFVDGKPIDDNQKVRLYRELKKALKELGFVDIVFDLQINEGLEELAKSSGFIGNDELLELMSMVAREPKR
ncbi:hypothetical protein [Proteus penneri]|uniref:Uncharacterized protein n=1 Tax=Proteus penneri TaxID=102862 RepID=A0ABS0W4Q2_9GAMM|nr:hypothetical protein [Proteus penneri]MBJ2118270.1 hypothetical protein [Proteus penneri]